MASNSEYKKVKDTLKQKYIEKVSNLSYTEQKNFKKAEYKKLVLNKMSELPPSYDKAQLKVITIHIQCVKQQSQLNTCPKGVGAFDSDEESAKYIV